MKLETEEKAVWFLWGVSVLLMICASVLAGNWAHVIQGSLPGSALSWVAHLWIIALVLGVIAGGLIAWKGPVRVGYSTLSTQWIVFVGIYGFIVWRVIASMSPQFVVAYVR